jgi:hypothetical protein
MFIQFKKTSNFLPKIFVVFLVFVWIFSGWPQIWQNPRIPPEIKEAMAQTPVQYTTTPLKVLPSAASGVSVTGSGTAWGNSSWVQVTASTPAAIVVVGVVVGGGVNQEFEIDIGKGPAGSETVVATISGNQESAASSPRWLPLPIPVDNIPSGTRVAVRVRKAGTTTTAWTIKLVYYEKPISGSIATTANPSLLVPSAAAGTSVTPSGTAWANSAWTQVIASTGNAIVLGGITINPAVAVEYEIDIGTGASGSETVVTTIRGRSTTAGAPQTIILKPLLDNIPTETRVAVRLRKAGTSTTAWTVKLIYYNKTGLGVGSEALTAKPLKWSPTGTAGVSVSPSATPWANSNWVQVIASAPTNLAIAALEFVPASAVDFEIEFGVGSAGNEVPIGLVRGRVLSTTLGDIFTMNIAPLINSVPSGSRVAVRIRTSGTTTTAWTMSVGYYENPDTTNVSDLPHQALPSASNAISISSAGTAWANSAYGEITAGINQDAYITRVITNTSAAAQFEVDIAIGASGSETVVTTVAGQTVSATGNSIIDLPAPLKISAGNRIAISFRSSATGVTGFFALEYVPVSPTFNQSAYRFFDNVDSTAVSTALAAQDTAATLGSSGAAFRLRMLIHIGTADLAISGQSFKLQFAQRGTDNLCDTAFSGETYADVTAATVIAFNDNPTPADGAGASGSTGGPDPSHNSHTTAIQTYEEANNFTNSVSAIISGDDGLWDFSLKDNGAAANTAYCLRAVKSDGTVLDTYTVIPQITTASSAPTPTLTFSISDNTIGFGTLSQSAPRFATGDGAGSATEVAAHTISVSTNATDGYVITIDGTTLTYGSNTINPIGGTATNVSTGAGTEQFGIRLTLSSGTGGSVTPPYNGSSNFYAFDVANFPDQIASGSGDGTTDTYSVFYAANISNQTEAGNYTAVITYIATGTF